MSMNMLQYAQIYGSYMHDHMFLKNKRYMATDYAMMNNLSAVIRTCFNSLKTIKTLRYWRTLLSQPVMHDPCCCE